MKPALHFPRLGKTLLAAALVATFGIASLPAEAKPKQASAAGKPIKGDINAGKALTFLYGNAKAKGRTHYATVRKIERQPTWDAEMAKTFAGKSARADIVHEARYTEQGKEKYLIITGISLPNGNGCFACGPLAEGALFAKEGGKWVLEAQSKYLSAIGGGYGNVGGEFKMIEVGRGKYGLLQAAKGAGRGDCEDAYYSITMPHNGGLGSFGFNFGDGEMALGYCLSYLEDEWKKCSGSSLDKTGGQKGVDGAILLDEFNESEYPGQSVGDWGGKLMAVDAGAEYYDIVMQSKHRDGVCKPVTWEAYRFRFENGGYKKAGAK